MRSRICSSLIATLAGVLTLAGSLVAQAEILMAVPGIDGDDVHGRWVYVESMSLPIQRARQSSLGTLSLSAPVELPTIHLSVPFFRDAERLLALAVDGEPLGTIDVLVVDPEDSSHTYLKYKLERCFVKSWSVSGDADGVPIIDFAFTYEEIRWGR